MRTAVIRVNVDPTGGLGPADVRRGLDVVLASVGELGLRLVSEDLVSLPAKRRELQFLADGDDPAALRQEAAELCRIAFATEPAVGATTFLSRGSDDDVNGVLAGFGLAGQVTRESGDEGWDVVTVRLAEADLRRVPESRIQTALEASLNCEVRIVVT
ncbi:MAG TPA: hypothetical protein VHZ33_17645 [Trebonia sp.]|jgi:hypothetical protein|nr:hypothetical protein [Trebonia sp.]